MSTQSQADVYAGLLKIAAEGWALWHPDDIGAVGDCGYLAEGSFFKLFNVFRPPAGLPAIPPPTAAEFKSGDRSNQGLRWRAAQSEDWNVDAEIPIPLLPTEVGFGFEASRSNGAASFLIPGGTTRRVEICTIKRCFEKYLLHNYKAIRAMYPRSDLQTIVILQGTTRSASWCRGLCRSTGHEFQGFVSVDVAPILPTFKVGLGHAVTVHHPWNVESGPVPQNQSAQQTQDSEIFNQCIIVQPVTMRRRDKMLASLHSPFTASTVSSGSASPGGKSPSPGLGGSTTSGSLGSAPSGATLPGTHSRGNNDQQDANSGHLSAAYGSAHSDSSDTLSQLEASVGSNSSASLNEALSTRNAIEVTLDSYLDANPDIDAVVASWDTLYAQWSRAPGFKFTPIQTEGDERLGILDVTDMAVQAEEETHDDTVACGIPMSSPSSEIIPDPTIMEVEMARQIQDTGAIKPQSTGMKFASSELMRKDVLLATTELSPTPRDEFVVAAMVPAPVPRSVGAVGGSMAQGAAAPAFIKVLKSLGASMRETFVTWVRRCRSAASGDGTPGCKTSKATASRKPSMFTSWPQRLSHCQRGGSSPEPLLPSEQASDPSSSAQLPSSTFRLAPSRSDQRHTAADVRSSRYTDMRSIGSDTTVTINTEFTDATSLHHSDQRISPIEPDGSAVAAAISRLGRRKTVPDGYRLSRDSTIPGDLGMVPEVDDGDEQQRPRPLSDWFQFDALGDGQCPDDYVGAVPKQTPSGNCKPGCCGHQQ